MSNWFMVLFSQSLQSFSCVRLFATPWNAARQASLSITNSRSLLKLMSVELVMPLFRYPISLLIFCLIVLSIFEGGFLQLLELWEE